jgi:hypothetical protein
MKTAPDLSPGHKTAWWEWAHEGFGRREVCRGFPQKRTAMKGLMFLPFVALTFVSWGLYGPTLHLGQDYFGGDGQRAAFRPFICVGLAYFLVAVVVPALVLRVKGEAGQWTVKGVAWSFSAGAIGAVGALGIILALKFGGDPIYVMPLVFGCAPVVNTLVTMLMSGNFKQASWPFFVGIIIVAVGAAGVLVHKPSKPKAEPTTASIATSEENGVADRQSAVDAGLTEGAMATTGAVSETPVIRATPVADQVEGEEFTDADRGQFASMILRVVFILMTALCWGAYGPVLHKGQQVMGGSRMRPFLCVGLAYFVVAVVFPLAIQNAFRPEPGSWFSVLGWFWSVLGGALGALGALGIIYAFNFGGKPLFVMPLVFGIAPVVNTFSEIIGKGLWGQVGSLFYLSLFLVIAGAVTVLTTAPKPKAPKPAH